ncbi:MAG TPA: hypothetical protein VIS51_04330 [Solirubrobacterales bacterium]
MDTKNPESVLESLGNVEDSLALLEKTWPDDVEKELKLAEALNTMRHNLRDEAEGGSAEDRKAWVERKIRESEDFTEWLDLKAAKNAASTRFEVLSKRLSACQSALNRMPLDGNGQMRQGRRS